MWTWLWEAKVIINYLPLTHTQSSSFLVERRSSTTTRHLILFWAVSSTFSAVGRNDNTIFGFCNMQVLRVLVTNPPPNPQRLENPRAVHCQASTRSCPARHGRSYHKSIRVTRLTLKWCRLVFRWSEVVNIDFFWCKTTVAFWIDINFLFSL